MDIRPKAICRQLFAIREQISGELIDDLRELPRKDNELSKARALYDEDRPSFDESRLGDADGSRASPFRAATYELALQLCTAFAVESILSNVDDRELERTWRAHREGFFCHNVWSRGDATRRSETPYGLRSSWWIETESACGEGMVACDWLPSGFFGRFKCVVRLPTRRCHARILGFDPP